MVGKNVVLSQTQIATQHQKKEKFQMFSGNSKQTATNVFTTSVFYISLLGPSFVVAEDAISITKRLDCLEAQLAAAMDVIAKPTKKFHVNLHRVPAFTQNKQPLVTVPGAIVEIPKDYSGREVVINYKVSTQSIPGENLAAHFTVNSIWINDEELVAMRSIQSGHYHGNAGNWTGILEGQGPFKVELRYRVSPAVRETALGDYKAVYLEAVVKRIPKWPEDECGLKAPH